MLEATMKLGISRQTVLQRVKRGDLEAMLVGQADDTGLANQSRRRSTHAICYYFMSLGAV